MGFLVRVFPRIRLKNVFSSDTYFHLYCAKVLDENNLKIPPKFSRIILDHEYSYPFGYHWFLSLFKNKLRYRIERMTGAIFDSLSIIIIFIFLNTNFITYSEIPIKSKIPLMISSLLAFSPALLRMGSGPRAYNGSPRTIGQFLYLVHILSAYSALNGNEILLFAISLISGGIAIITAKFTTQVTLFFGVFFVLFIEPGYGLLVIGCFIFSILISNGRSLKILNGHIIHSLIYFKFLQKVFLYPHLKTGLQYLKEMVRILKSKNLKSIIEWIWITEKHPIHLILFVYPQYILLIYVFFQISQITFFDKFLLIWTIAGFFLFVITKWSPLLFLGEGERYLEYSLFPSITFIIIHLNKLSIIFYYLFLVYSVFCAFYYMKFFYSKFKIQNENFLKIKEAFNVLNKLPAGVIWPIGSFHYQALYNAHEHPVLTHGANLKFQSLDDFNLVYANYPYPSKNFKEIILKYKVKYIISDEIHLKYYFEKICMRENNLSEIAEILFKSSVLQIWMLKNKDNGKP